MEWLRRIFGGFSKGLVLAAVEVAVMEAKAKLEKSRADKNLNDAQLAVALAAIDEVVANIKAELLNDK